MSWDVWLEGEFDGQTIDLVESVNYTHNCNGMIRDNGMPEWPYSLDGMPSDEFCTKLKDTIASMMGNLAELREQNPENGWGDVDSLLSVLIDIYTKFTRFPSGIVRCCA